MNQPKYGRSGAAMTNTERQRRFRERHPGYYGRLHAERRAIIDAMGAAQRAATAVALPARPLLLPAPVEPIVFPTMAELRAQREAVCVER